MDDDDNLMRELRKAGLLHDDGITDINVGEDHEFDDIKDDDELDVDYDDLHDDTLENTYHDDVPAERVVNDTIPDVTLNDIHAVPDRNDPDTVEKKPRKKREAKPKAEKPVVTRASVDPTDQAVIDTLPVKIKEKATQLVKGQKLSVYTRVAVDTLRAGKPLVMKDLVDDLTSGRADGGKRYSIGTARSQAQQVVALFKRFDITDNNGNLNKGNRFSNIFN